MSISTKSQRQALLRSAGTAMIAALVLAPVSPARATDATIDTRAADLYSTVLGHVVVGDGAAQSNSGNVNATVTSLGISVTTTGSTTGSFQNSSNTGDANAYANRNGATVSLASIGSTPSFDDGIAVASTQSNTGTGAITSVATDQAVGISSTGFTDGSVEVKSNVIAANTTINDGAGSYAITVNGAEPVGYTNESNGNNATVSADLSGGSEQLSAVDGSVVVSSVQKTASNDSSATVGGLGDGDSVTIDLLASGPLANTVTGSVTLDSNTLAATFKGNARTASIGLNSADGSIEGTAAISSVQSYDGNASAVQATSSNNEVSVDLLGDTTGPASYVNALSGGTLSVASNIVAASATGNTTTGSITVADAQSLSGGNNTATVYLGQDDDASLSGSPVDVSASAGLVIGVTQLSGTGVAATSKLQSAADSNTIRANVQETSGSSIDLSSNTISSAATGNAVASSVSSGSGSALFDGSVALASQQKANDFDVSAFATSNAISVTAGYRNSTPNDGVVENGSITLDGNVTAAAATGNSANQSVALDATTLTLGSAGASLTVDGAPASTHAGAAAPAGTDTIKQYVTASGAVLVSSLQINGTSLAGNGSSVSASNTGSTITLTSNDSARTSANMEMALTNSVQQAYAQGSDATNAIALTGVTVGSEAGVVAYQLNAVGSTVTASNTGKASVAVSGDLGSAADGGSSIALTGNAQQAIAIGGNTDNSITVDAVTVAVDPTERAGGTNALATEVKYSTGSGGQAFDLGATAPTVNAAYGILNNQVILADATATANSSAGAAFSVSVSGSDGSVIDSSVANSSNSLVAQAQGAVAASSEDLSITSLSLNSGFATIGAVGNVQAVGDAADITASAVPVATAAVFATAVDGTVTNSTVAASNNEASAIADGAKAANSLIVSGTTLSAYDGGVGTHTGGINDVASDLTASVDAAFAVSNAQSGGTGTVEATLQRVSPVTSTTDSVQVLTSVGNVVSGSTVTSAGNLLRALADSNEAANTLTVSGTTLRSSAGINNLQISQSDVIATVGGDTGVANQYQAGGVTVSLGDNVSSSSVAVTANKVQGSAIGNIGANALTATASTILGEGSNSVGIAYFQDTVSSTAEADFTINSYQEVGSSSSQSTTVGATFAIDQLTNSSISDSSLSVSSNEVYGEALGNTATNTLRISGTDLNADPDTGTSAALLSTQLGSSVNIDVASTMDVAANVQSSGSSIALNGNSNTALGVINNATNTLSASAVNFTDAANVGYVFGSATGNADARATFALSNKQDASGNLDSTATTTVKNVEAWNTPDNQTDGLINGSASLSSNATRAESSANRASNSVAVDGSADLGATAALGNSQESTATVNATANATVTFQLYGDGDKAINGSAVSVDGNSTTAVARGNSAANAMTFTAGATYSTPTLGTIVDGTTAAVYGAASILNAQANSGNVTASSSVTYRVILNQDGANGAALNAAVAVTNNSQTALAYGNSATNVVGLAALNTGMPTVAVNNQQTNSGAISAQVTSVTYGVTATGSVGATSIRNNGNSVNAQAVGNSVFTTIGAR